MNNFRITLILLFLATMLILPATISAVSSPDTININQVDVYQGVLTDNDQLYVITYDLEYSDTPPAGLNSEDLFLIRLLDASDSQLGVTVPSAYYNDGFDTGVAGIYFSAGDVDTLGLTFGPGSGYYINMVGNPMIAWDAALPPFENKLTFANYYNDDVQDTLHTRLSVMINIIQNDWYPDTDNVLIEGPNREQILTAIGEEYMTEAIVNLRTLCPSLFQSATVRSEYEDTEVISDFYVGGDSTSTNASGNRYLAQTFTAMLDYELDRIAIKANITGTPSDVSVLLYTSSGSPATLIASGTIPGTDFMTSPVLDWEECALSPTQLNNDDEYAIVLVCNSGTVNWRYDPSSTYNGNALLSANNGTTWSNIANSTFMFQTKAKGANDLSYMKRMEHQLDGTVFEMASSEDYFGMSSMFIRSLLWMIVAIVIGAFIAYETQNPKPITPVFFWITGCGYFIGMVDPYIALGFATIGGLLTIYMTLFNRAAT